MLPKKVEESFELEPNCKSNSYRKRSGGKVNLQHGKYMTIVLHN